jgi:fatty aldehyde decarbonylase
MGNIHSVSKCSLPDFTSIGYREAYSRINGMVIVGEGLADRHFRHLAKLFPADGEELLRLGAMEACHAKDFVGCGRNLGVKADASLAHKLLAPLHKQFIEAETKGDIVSCLVIQCIIIECFAIAAYRTYLPVADSYAKEITQLVLNDEFQHLNYGEEWLKTHFDQVVVGVEACIKRAVPIAMNILTILHPDLKEIGMEPSELAAEFVVCFQESLERMGFIPKNAQKIIRSLMAAQMVAR